MSASSRASESENHVEAEPLIEPVTPLERLLNAELTRLDDMVYNIQHWSEVHRHYQYDCLFSNNPYSRPYGSSPGPTASVANRRAANLAEHVKQALVKCIFDLGNPEQQLINRAAVRRALTPVLAEMYIHHYKLALQGRPIEWKYSTIPVTVTGSVVSPNYYLFNPEATTDIVARPRPEDRLLPWIRDCLRVGIKHYVTHCKDECADCHDLNMQAQIHQIKLEMAHPAKRTDLLDLDPDMPGLVPLLPEAQLKHHAPVAQPAAQAIVPDAVDPVDTAAPPSAFKLKSEPQPLALASLAPDVPATENEDHHDSDAMLEMATALAGDNLKQAPVNEIETSDWLQLVCTLISTLRTKTPSHKP